MKSFVLTATIVLGAIIAFAACTASDQGNVAQTTPAPSTPAQTTPAQITPAPVASVRPPQGDGVRRINVAEARAALDKGEAVMVDVRLKNEFDAGHIKGSKSLPKSEILSRADELPKDKLIIAYCA